jgi:hypothetical protein
LGKYHGFIDKPNAMPYKQSKIGDENGVNVFYIYIDSNAEALFDTDPGRTAVSSLRLRYMAQEGTPVT